METIEQENTTAVTEELERLLKERPFGVSTAVLSVANVAVNIRLASDHKVCDLLARASSELGFDADEAAEADAIIQRFRA